jgi:hypothetical protein
MSVKKKSKKILRRKLTKKKKPRKALINKLGVKNSFRMGFIGATDQMIKDFKIPKGVIVSKKLHGAFDYIHVFVNEAVKLEKQFREARSFIKMNGMIWISWPKHPAGVTTDLNENSIRDIGHNLGLVDVKVASLDDTWFALKFVYL